MVSTSLVLNNGSAVQCVALLTALLVGWPATTQGDVRGKEDAALILEYRGVNLGGGRYGPGEPVFDVVIFRDGRVKYFGEERVYVRGDQETKVSKAEVMQWLDALQRAGVMDMVERPNFTPIPDASWYRLTVRLGERSNSFRAVGWGRSEHSKILDTILERTGVRSRWVCYPGAPERC